MQNQLKDSEEIIIRRIARRLDRYLLELEKRVQQNKVNINSAQSVAQFQPESNATRATVALDLGESTNHTKTKAISIRNVDGADMTKSESPPAMFSQNEKSGTVQMSEMSGERLTSKMEAENNSSISLQSSGGFSALSPDSDPEASLSPAPSLSSPPPLPSPKLPPLPDSKKIDTLVPRSAPEKNSIVNKENTNKTKSKTKRKIDPFREFKAEKSADSRVDLLFTENHKKGINLPPLTRVFVIILALVAAIAVCFQLWEYFFYS